MTLELRNSPDPSLMSRIGRQARLAFGLMILAVPLSGCGTGALWDKDAGF